MLEDCKDNPKVSAINRSETANKNFGSAKVWCGGGDDGSGICAYVG